MTARPSVPSTPSRRSVAHVAGLCIDRLGIDAATDELVRGPRPGSVHLCNAYTVALAANDADYRATLNRGDRNLVDGAPLRWVLQRRQQWPGGVHPCGPDLMYSVLRHGESVGLRHFFFGSTHAVLASLVDRVQAMYPDCIVVGVESPPFGDLEQNFLENAARRIDGLGADVVWVGLGTPKQDVAVDVMSRCGRSTYVAIGAAFEFIAGTKPRAPTWMRRCGLEWLFRLMTEPRRLGLRYLWGNLRFLRAVVTDR